MSRMVKINATKCERVSVGVSFFDMVNAIEIELLRSVGLRPGQWIENGKVYEEVHTSHSWTDCLGAATKEQAKVYKAWETVLDTLRKPGIS